jgi:hypothetical protein
MREATQAATGASRLQRLPNGHAGFIRASDGAQLYFETREWKERGAKPTEGASVSFTTRPGFDRKKQRSTTVACEVRAASLVR